MSTSCAPWVYELCEELRRRWHAGQRNSTIESLSHVDPRLRQTPEALLALITTEVSLRREAGDTPTVDEYVQRFPELTSELRQRSQEWSNTPPLMSTLNPTPADPFGTVDRVTPVVEDTPAPAAPSATPALPSATPADPGATLDPEAADVQRTTDYTPPAPGSDLASTKMGATPPPLNTPDLPSTRMGAKPQRFAALGLPTIAGYVILGELGKGGMGVVYKAEQAGLKRLVALKMILGKRGIDEDDIARFRLEAEAIARIKHPNIVQIYEIGEHEGKPYFSLEYIEGGSLAGRLKESLLPAGEAARLTELLARAIHAAHETNIIHRDLKPANVLLAADGTPKVTDFGLAKELDAATEHTHSGAVLGTPSYMAPEQAEGRTQDIGPPADIYALGGILYEMLAGRPAFKGSTLLETLNQVKHADPVPPSRLQARVPRDLETICLKCLAKDVSKRYATAGDLADDLRRFLNREPIRARRTPFVERASLWMRRNPWKAGAWAAGATALLVGAIFLTQDIGRRVRLAQLRLQTQDLLIQAQDDHANHRPQDALDRANLALGAIGEEESLADLRPAAESTRNEALAELKRQERARKDGEQFQAFRKGRNQVQLKESIDIIVGRSDADEEAQEKSEREARTREIRDAAARTLALYGVSADSKGLPALDDLSLKESEKREILPACYELLLTAAEATAVPLPGEDRKAQAEQALRLLARAEEFPITSQALLIDRARYLRQADRADDAVAEEQKINRNAPSGATDQYLIGVHHYREAVRDPRTAAEQLAAAIQCFQQCLKEKPNHFAASYTLATCYLRQRRWDGAKAMLTQCIALQEDNREFIWTYLLRGYAHAELGEFAAAQADFKQVEALNPNASDRYSLFVNRGMARFLEHGSAERDKKLPPEKRQEIFDAAVHDLKQAIALNADKYQAHANLGEFLYRQGKLVEAQQHLDRAIELKPLPGLYRSRARLHLARQEFAEALPDLEKAIAKHGDTRSAVLAEDHVECGRIHFRQKKYAEALATFNRAIKAHPGDYPYAHRLKAETLIELNRFTEAIDELNEYLKTGKAVAGIFRARGLAQAKLQKYDRAVEDYTQALDCDRREGKPPAPKTLAYRGWAYLLCDAPKLAQADFEAVLKTQPGDANALTGRGNARVRLGDTKAALADAEAALRESPASDRIFYNAARVYALAAARAEADAKDIKDPIAAERAARTQRRRLEDRAIRLLEDSVRLVPEREREQYWKLYVETDPTLKTLRKTAGYQRLSGMYMRAAK